MKTIGQEAAEEMHDEKLIFISQMEPIAAIIDKIVRERGEADTKRLDCLDGFKTGNIEEPYWKIYARGQNTLREAIDAVMKGKGNEKRFFG